MRSGLAEGSLLTVAGLDVGGGGAHPGADRAKLEAMPVERKAKVLAGPLCGAAVL